MTAKQILFGSFEFQRIRGLEYWMDENKPVTDSLLVNQPHKGFFMYFEKDFPAFTVPENSTPPYCLFEMKRPDRVIKFFCPETHQTLDSAIWYFYTELFDEHGTAHGLLGQVCVRTDPPFLRHTRDKPLFIRILEQIKLCKAIETAG